MAFSGRFEGGGLGITIKIAGPSCTDFLVPSKFVLIQLIFDVTGKLAQDLPQISHIFLDLLCLFNRKCEVINDNNGLYTCIIYLYKICYNLYKEGQSHL